MKVSADELRAFAGSLDADGLRGDLSRPGQAVVTCRIASAAMPETKDPDSFIAEWGPLLERTATDLVRCMETLNSVARTAADQFESTDQNHALIMRKLLEQAQGGEASVDPESLSEAPTTRDGGDLQHRPDTRASEVTEKYGDLGGGIPRPEIETDGSGSLPATEAGSDAPAPSVGPGH